MLDLDQRNNTETTAIVDDFWNTERFFEFGETSLSFETGIYDFDFANDRLWLEIAVMLDHTEM